MLIHSSSINTILIPAPWLSFRSYLTQAGEARSLIFDERMHQTYFLDGLASSIWSMIEKKCTTGELQEFASISEIGDEVDTFLEQMKSDGLVRCIGQNQKVEEFNLNEFSQAAAPEPKAFENSEADAPLREFIQWVADQGFLYSVHWEITWRCNERCIHCYNPGAAHLAHEKPERDTNELSTDEVFRVLEELKELGVFSIILSGGEPMLRSDFWEIVGKMRQMGFQVAIYTNGLKLGGENATRLASLYPNSVSLSVYSNIPEAHDSVTRVPGSFIKTTGVLRRMRELGVPTYMKSIQMNHTVRSYASTHELAKELGAGAEVDMMMTASADGASAPLALAAQRPEELIVMAATPGSPLYVGSLDEGFHFIQRDPDSSVCGAGITTMALDPEGNIVPCSSLPIPSGSVRREGIASVWKNSHIHRNRTGCADRRGTDDLEDALSKWQSITLKDYHECGTHDRCAWCAKCPGLAMLEHGDPLAPSTTNCRLATARMLAAGFLSAGETRETLCQKLEVDPRFGHLPPLDPVLARQEEVRGTGFSPKAAALQNLGCGGGCSGCSAGSLPAKHEAYGKITLRTGSNLTAVALESVYSIVEKLGLKQVPKIQGVPPPVRQISQRVEGASLS